MEKLKPYAQIPEDIVVISQKANAERAADLGYLAIESEGENGLDLIKLKPVRPRQPQSTDSQRVPSPKHRKAATSPAAATSSAAATPSKRRASSIERVSEIQPRSNVKLYSSDGDSSDDASLPAPRKRKLYVRIRRAKPLGPSASPGKLNCFVF